VFYDSTDCWSIPCQADIQTISWPEIVRRIGNIRNQNPTTSLRKPGDSSDAALEIDVSAPKLDAHDVAK
jgi:autophagy-related protein 9